MPDEEERKPDLAGPDNEAVEERVREMMDPGSEEKKPKKIAITHFGSDSETAPEVPDKPAKKGRKKATKAKAKPEPAPEPDDTEVPERVLTLDAAPTPEDIVAAAEEAAAVTDMKETPPDESKTEEPAAEPEPESEAETTEPETEEPEVEPEPEIEPAEPAEEEPESETAPEVETTPEETPTEAEPPEEPAEEPEPPTEPEEPAPLPPLPGEDEETAKAVDEIVAEESDQLLAAEDEKKAAAVKPPKLGLGRRLGHFLTAWWRSPKARWMTLSFLFLGLVVAGAIPPSRYFMLNSVGVRSSALVTVLDESTQQPLKNVVVSLAGQTGQTGVDGKVRLTKVKLGPGQLSIEKRAFASVKRNVTLGWGSNPLGEFQLAPTGTQYEFAVNDFLSGKGVDKVEAISGNASAVSDEEGKLKLTVEEPGDEALEITFKKDGFRDEKLTLNPDTKEVQTVKMVPARQHVFISKRSGKYDVYKIYLDGQDEQLVLAGTGNERDDITLIPHPTSEIVALVSTREEKRNSDGFLLSTLTIIDLSDNSTSTVAQSERVQVVDWVGDRLLYVRVAAGASASDPKRHRLMTYDFDSGDNKELASSNYFNDVLVAAGKLYYAPSSAYQGSGAVLYQVDADGSNRRTLLEKETWNIFRTSYDHLTLSVQQQWYDYRLGDTKATKLDGSPGNTKSRVYIDSPAGKTSLWVDNRDGKGVLLAYEPSTKDELVLRTQSGLKNPVSWLNERVVVYRINTEQETADYALSLDGGEPVKIRDVTNTSGIDTWYYY